MLTRMVKEHDAAQQVRREMQGKFIPPHIFFPSR